MALPAIAGPIQEPIQLPDVRRLEQMPSLPAWVASRIASIKIEMQPDRTTGKWRADPTLPVDLDLEGGGT